MNVLLLVAAAELEEAREKMEREGKNCEERLGNGKRMRQSENGAAVARRVTVKEEKAEEDAMEEDEGAGGKKAQGEESSERDSEVDGDEEDEEDDEEEEKHGGGLDALAGAIEKADRKRPGENKRWTPEQDEALRQAVTRYNGQSWKAIARFVEGRDHVQCLQRWKKVLQPGLVKGMWSKEEDDLLLQLMSTSQPRNWAEVAALVPGRTAKQCRERWSLSLDPSINRGPWTQEEDNLLIKLHERLGNRWALIKNHLASRTENAVKTRFKTIERARVKDAMVKWTPELEEQLRELAVRFEGRIEEVTKHLPRTLRGISSQAMREHCALLRESEEKSLSL